MPTLHRICLGFLVCLLLAGCGAPTVPPQPTVLAAVTAAAPTGLVTPTQAATQIPQPTQTISPTYTRTPPPPAQCPADDDQVEPPVLGQDWSPMRLKAEVLAALNAGGMGRLVAAGQAGELGEYQAAEDIVVGDVTGDGIDEVLIRYPFGSGDVYVFGCQQGKYANLLIEPSIVYFFPDMGPRVLAIQDLNENGVPELAIAHYTCHYCRGMRVYEWDGQQLQSLIRVRLWEDEELDNDLLEFADMATLDGYADAVIKDIDGDGTFELILEGGTPGYFSGSEGFDGPYREKTLTYQWDGEHYTFASIQFAPPNFRFEAVQDGDLESVLGNYDQALTSYQEAIFSDQLNSWTPEIWRALLDENVANMVITPPDPTRMPFNQTEYDQLSAYARYRILLLHLVNDDASAARTVYQELVDRYPEGNPGYPYVELAGAAWNAYQDSPSMNSVCGAAIKHARAHPELLDALGGQTSFSWISRYEPEDICPFGAD